MDLSWPLLLWAGFSATIAVTWLAFVARRFGWTRLSPVRVLGCFFASNADGVGSRLIGTLLHFAAGGIVLPLIYGVIFELTGQAEIPFGLALGALHGIIAGLALPLITSQAHCTGVPRDPGIFGWRLGLATPPGLLLAHALYGGVLGYVYVVPGK
jgi:hypothetical protein